METFWSLIVMGWAEEKFLMFPIKLFHSNKKPFSFIPSHSVIRDDTKHTQNFSSAKTTTSINNCLWLYGTVNEFVEGKKGLFWRHVNDLRRRLNIQLVDFQSFKKVISVQETTKGLYVPKVYSKFDALFSKLAANQLTSQVAALCMHSRSIAPLKSSKGRRNEISILKVRRKVSPSTGAL